MKNHKGPPRRPYTTGLAAIDSRIEELTRSFKDGQDRRLISEIITSAYRMGQGQASTIDLKIVNSALKELQHAFKVFRPYGHVRKVATFGSARVSRQHPAYGMAKEFGERMVKAGWMVITGAASGIMKAGHEGAGRASSFGLNIRLPFEQEANPVIARDSKLINCKYFFTRKLLFIKESHATALFPGGFGTLDEGFENLTLIQTGKSDPRPIVFVEPPGGGFWEGLLKFFDERLCREGMISLKDTSLYKVTSSAQEASEVILRFYSVYHSLRYVNEQVVLRLMKPLPGAALAKLTRDFQDIIVSGSLHQGKALLEEQDEPELAHLTRLVFHFNRKDFGRLIEMIHQINGVGASHA